MLPDQKETQMRSMRVLMSPMIILVAPTAILTTHQTILALRKRSLWSVAFQQRGILAVAAALGPKAEKESEGAGRRKEAGTKGGRTKGEEKERAPEGEGPSGAHGRYWTRTGDLCCVKAAL